MSNPRHLPPLGWDVASAVISGIGLALFILPILSLPLTGMGIVLGLIGIVAARRGHRTNLRLAVAGVLFSSFAFTVILAIAIAQNGYFAPRRVTLELPSVPKRSYIPPPAPPPSGPLHSTEKSDAKQAA